MSVPREYALSIFRTGKLACEQPLGVRGHLKALEKAGLVLADGGDGGVWYITDAGMRQLGICSTCGAARDACEHS